LLSLQVDHPALIMAATLFGIMGASFSGILSISKASMETKTPDLLMSGWFSLARPVVGALSALAVYALLTANVLQLGNSVAPGLILAAAVAAGFSERLVVNALSGLGGGKA
jgi:hypothetical protein